MHYLITLFKLIFLSNSNCHRITIFFKILQSPEEVKANADAAYNYGRSIGIAIQLIDDIHDYVASSEQLGKTAANDLKLGLATAPVLFAMTKFPELEDMIARRFNKPGDVEKAFEFVSTYVLLKIKNENIRCKSCKSINVEEVIILINENRVQKM